MNKDIYNKYLSIYVNSNESSIKEFIKKENISIEEFNAIIIEYTNYLKKESKKSGKLNKLYLQYCLKDNNKKNLSKEEIVKNGNRKEAEKILNIINNYINEDKHNIKEYTISNSLEYKDFIKFINNSKNYYLKDKEKKLLKLFLKRENDFNKNNIDKVKKVIDKISDDLVNDKPYNIYDYYKDLGWDNKLLIFYLTNNKEHFSDFVIGNVRLYFKKYISNEKILKSLEFVDLIKIRKPELTMKSINQILEYMNKYNMPYIYSLFETVVLKTNIK